MEFSFQKPLGYSTSDIENEIREKYKLPLDEKVACMGKLDPMASGNMIVLTGIKCKDTIKYRSMDKTYNFNLHTGLSTDTGDFLGLLDRIEGCVSNLDQDISLFSGLTYSQDFPLYSAYKIKGKPLWWYAKQKLDVPIPSKKITIYSLKINNKTITNFKDITNNCLDQLSKVRHGELFRLKEIKDLWNDKVQIYLDTPIITYNITAMVSSGTYIRQIAFDLMKNTQVPCMVSDIHRISYHMA